MVHAFSMKTVTAVLLLFTSTNAVQTANPNASCPSKAYAKGGFMNQEVQPQQEQNATEEEEKENAGKRWKTLAKKVLKPRSPNVAAPEPPHSNVYVKESEAQKLDVSSLQVMKLLKKSGQSTVWKVLDTTHEKLYALKVNNVKHGQVYPSVQAYKDGYVPAYVESWLVSHQKSAEFNEYWNRIDAGQSQEEIFADFAERLFPNEDISLEIKGARDHENLASAVAFSPGEKVPLPEGFLVEREVEGTFGTQNVSGTFDDTIWVKSAHVLDVSKLDKEACASVTLAVADGERGDADVVKNGMGAEMSLGERGDADIVKNDMGAEMLSNFPWMLTPLAEAGDVFEYRAGYGFEAGEGAVTSDDVKPIPVSYVWKLAKDILSALAYVHGHNEVHADMKPENILIQKPKDGEETALPTFKLFDFGFCKNLTPGHPSTGRFRIDPSTGQFVIEERLGAKGFIDAKVWDGNVLQASTSQYTAPELDRPYPNRALGWDAQLLGKLDKTPADFHAVKSSDLYTLGQTIVDFCGMHQEFVEDDNCDQFNPTGIPKPSHDIAKNLLNVEEGPEGQGAVQKKHVEALLFLLTQAEPSKRPPAAKLVAWMQNIENGKTTLERVFDDEEGVATETGLFFDFKAQFPDCEEIFDVTQAVRIALPINCLLCCDSDSSDKVAMAYQSLLNLDEMKNSANVTPEALKAILLLNSLDKKGWDNKYQQCKREFKQQHFRLRDNEIPSNLQKDQRAHNMVEPRLRYTEWILGILDAYDPQAEIAARRAERAALIAGAVPTKSGARNETAAKEQPPTKSGAKSKKKKKSSARFNQAKEAWEAEIEAQSVSTSLPNPSFEAEIEAESEAESVSKSLPNASSKEMEGAAPEACPDNGDTVVQGKKKIIGALEQVE